MKLQSFSLKLKTVLYKIREIIWPLLEAEKPTEQDESIQKPNIELNVWIENLDQALILVTKIFEDEEERRKGVESKASLFIGTISVSTSIVVAANSMVISNTNFDLFILVSVVLSSVLSLYAVRTVWFAIKALERESYSVLGIKEINFEGNKHDFKRHIINNLYMMRERNKASINNKVNYFVMAQEYYKRSIIIIFMYSLLILIQCILHMVF